MIDCGDPTEDLDILCNEMEQCFMQDDWKSARFALGKHADPLQALADKAPRYAEDDPKAGQPFMPGVDECWCYIGAQKRIRNIKAMSIFLNPGDVWRIFWIIHSTGEVVFYFDFYSTEASAKAAMEAK